MVALLAALLLMTSGTYTAINMENPPAELGLVVDRYGHLQVASGDVYFAAVGNDPDGTRLYFPTFKQTLAESYWWWQGITYPERIRRVTAFRAEKLSHELAHIVDINDDGELNGSPGHLDYVSDDPYCRSNEAERYACAVVETGRIK